MAAKIREQDGLAIGAERGQVRCWIAHPEFWMRQGDEQTRQAKDQRTEAHDQECTS